MERMPTFTIKYLVDKLIACGLLLLLFPFFVTIALAIIIEGFLVPSSRGAVLHRETRITAGKPFHLYKFRALKQAVLDAMGPEDSATFLQFEPENLTVTGAFLIRFYLDELPQLVSILIGDMSFVGPRPRIPPVYEKNVTEGFTALAKLRAGFTGPHQLSKGTDRYTLERSEE